MQGYLAELELDGGVASDAASSGLAVADVAKKRPAAAIEDDGNDNDENNDDSESVIKKRPAIASSVSKTKQSKFIKLSPATNKNLLLLLSLSPQSRRRRLVLLPWC